MIKENKRKNLILLIGLVLIGSLPLGSCTKFLDGNLPKGTMLAPEVFREERTALSAISGLYTSWEIYMDYRSTIHLGMYADELINTTNTENDRPFMESFLPEDLTMMNSYWSALYQQVFRANSCIIGLENATELPPAVRDQFLGEAIFFRAITYLQLIQLFGDVPLVLGIDYRVNAIMPRTPAEKVYEQIVTDLDRARGLLKPAYPTGRAVRANKWAATALLARVHLFTKNWEQAEKMANEVIQSGQYPTELPALNTVFLVNSQEAILHLETGSSSTHIMEASQLIPSSTTVIPTYILTDELLNSFQDGDQRPVHWMGSNVVGGQRYYYPAKYKNRTGTTVVELYMILRLAEQYLIRAEALAQQGKLGGAISDLDQVRRRAGLPLIQETQPNIGKEALLSAILEERRLEFFTELGHRWFDLKRTGKADAVLTAQKPNTWDVRGIVWPVPEDQLMRNPFLEQSTGY